MTYVERGFIAIVAALDLVAVLLFSIGAIDAGTALLLVVLGLSVCFAAVASRIIEMF